MKNLLFLLAAAAIYFHFYPNEILNIYYDEKKAYLINKFNKLSNTKIQLKSSKIYEDLEGKLDRFSDSEVIHLKDISSSREKVKDFYLSICKTEKRDVVFHIVNEKKVCSTIAKYESLL